MTKGLLNKEYLDPRDYQARRGLLGAVDMTRPKLQNADSSFSTEETITIEQDGRFYNIPTIVQGQRVPEDAAVLLWRGGSNPHVGEFNSLEQALDIARSRSEMIGKVRR